LFVSSYPPKPERPRLSWKPPGIFELMLWARTNPVGLPTLLYQAVYVAGVPLSQVPSGTVTKLCAPSK
jgi:hypothetical protein